jgi:phage terminase large subunit GpA-like protein
VGDDSQRSPSGAEVERRLLSVELEKAERADIERELRRAEMMQKIARSTWQLARFVHRNDKDERVVFDNYPFQPDIYQDESPEQVIMGSVQWGKSLWLECVSLAMAGMGMKVLFVLATIEKRSKFVKERIDPLLMSVPSYRRLVQAAKEMGRESEGVGLKHFGSGSINFVASKSSREFTSYACDVGITDEREDCDQDNITLIPNRLSGSPWQFRIDVGNPRGLGSDDNQNLDWLYTNSDQQEWHVPCPACKVSQILTWGDHYVKQEVNKSGGIKSVIPRDENWDPKGILDMRPICPFCKRPMNRLAKKEDGAHWKALNPGHRRRGRRLSNLYNHNVKAAALFEQYLLAKSSPIRLQRFWNDQLGRAWSMAGSNITEQMMQSCSSGDSGVEPYMFIPSNFILGGGARP